MVIRQIRMSPQTTMEQVIHLPASKSLANRALIVSALCGAIDRIENLSTADDTRILAHYLQRPEIDRIDAGHGGTTFRFLLAYKALQGVPCTMTGSDRLIQRPVKPLVHALQQLGADVTYLGEPGYPPLRIGTFNQKTNRIVIPSDISSQFISALLMMGPRLEGGLELVLEGKIFSRPYIEMTLEIMAHYGAQYHWTDQVIRVEQGDYRPTSYMVEADWSAASYVYALAAFMPEMSFEMPKLFERSLQGDSQMAIYGEAFGIQTEYTESGVRIRKSGLTAPSFQADLIKEPDLSLALAVLCAGTHIPGYFNGLESLRIKETDRIAALDNELSKVGYRLLEQPEGEAFKYHLTGSYHIPNEPPLFHTYHDHRMAMSMACLSVFHPVRIEDPEVVRKSFPEFWEEMGFEEG